MGKASSAKKVARAARTGGGRTRRGTTSWVWPALMAAVVVFGTAGIVYSRDQRQPDNTRPLAAASGRAGDHWHAAIGFYICGDFAPDLPEGQDPLGIHTHGDGIVHIHPFSAASAGKRAQLKIFFDTVGAKVSASELKLPGDDTHKNGQRCGDQVSQIRMKVWDSKDPADPGRIVAGNPGDFRPQDGQLITIAFGPEGDDIPRPPSAPNLDKLTDVTPAAGATTTTAVGSSTSTSTPGDSSTTTTVASTSTSVASSTSTSTP